ncbi:ComEC/Rec2 family competence protein [Ruminococcus flavefaciens]|uniref:ComEC/Rec2 family competence protein n=1 Tax=Ruminococcus flavefaciens TaxID=1265 RepID=UPI0026EC5AF8|nr:MBL fold metallo-hydrolase [Ruminococcus flavefaciens]MDD7515973.1 MBL fold metallo-hydrolase [Ruminococcus flavefaciens]MDY5691672.1 MBL fold metallo-hydrolase [Ruminococcus flavefaciens]
MFDIRKAAAAAAASIIAAVSLCSCTKNTVPADAKEMKVTFFDVGKADSMVIQTDTGTVVIDCGEKGDGKKIVSLLNESGTTTIDYLIITHFDKDHVGGAPKVLNNFEVLNVLTPDYEGNNDEYAKYVKTIEEKNIHPTKLTSDMSFNLDDVKFTVYAPKKTFYGEDDENDFSLVTKVVHHNNTLLFTGDAMEQRLDEIMDIGRCTLLKVPYHGRKLDNIGDFLKAVKPKCAVVCTSNTEFSGKVQDLLSDMKIQTYATCFNGNITATSNGGEITFETEK